MPIHRIFEYRSERDRDLLNAYRRQIAQSSGPIQLREVMYRVVNSPSSRFWVSPERAMRVISSMDQGNRLNGMIRNKRIMFREIYRRVHQTQNSSALSAVTIIRGSPDSGWATRPLFLQDSTERHCDHAPHPKTPQTMQQFRIPFIVLLLVLFLLPVSPDQTGAVSGGPLWCYVVYMFFHANLFHLLGNCLSVYLVWHFRSDPPLCGSSFALRGGVAGCADHLHWYSDRRGFGCRLCLGGLSSESLPPEIITAKREMYLCYVREEDGDFC